MNMKRIYLLYLLLLLQTTAGYAQDSSQNYILTRTMLKSDTKSYLNKVVYYDGIGRPFQTVSKAIENTSKKECLLPPSKNMILRGARRKLGFRWL